MWRQLLPGVDSEHHSDARCGEQIPASMAFSVSGGGFGGGGFKTAVRRSFVSHTLPSFLNRLLGRRG
eukprot:COSAG03_NODE_26_length_19032_cov_87.110812_16_plen_67_part_00